jgi:hypothetical protein
MVNLILIYRCKKEEMIISKFVKIKINGRIINYYKNKGCKVEDEYIIVDIDKLKKGSNSKIRVKCDVCGDEKETTYKLYNKNIEKYNIYTCSNKCAQVKNKITSLDRYGVEHYSKTKEYINRVVEKNNIKYGKDFYTQTEEYNDIMDFSYRKNKEFQDKNKKNRILTNNKKYGVDYYQMSDDYKLKKDDIINKYKKTIELKILDKYKENLLFVNDNNNYTFFCERGNHEFNINRYLLKNRKKINTEICTICNPINSSSSSGYEKQLQEFIKNNYKGNISFNDRSFGKELDIYIPELKLSFEFNGLYWHNEINKPNNYHLEKTELCEEKGIQLIHIYEDDWIYKLDIVKSMILNKLGKIENKIFARKCEIKEVNDNKLVREFLENNHIQGFIGSKIKLGLFYENELVSLMAFGKRRVSMGKKSSQEGEYELLRFCSKLNTNVVGGANKLFKYFKKNYNPLMITTYADRSWSTGNLYYQLGFSFKGKTQPNYYYVIDGIRRHRFGFRKDVLVKEGYDASKTEHDIMLDRRIYRIYDSGNLKFEY